METTVKIVDLVKDVVIEREMDEKELSQFEADKAANLAKVNAENLKAIEKAQILERLGLTEDEAKLLLS